MALAVRRAVPLGSIARAGKEECGGGRCLCCRG